MIRAEIVGLSIHLDLRAYQRDVALDFGRPGKPTDNAFAESFNGKVRAECLNTDLLLKNWTGLS